MASRKLIMFLICFIILGIFISANSQLKQVEELYKNDPEKQKIMQDIMFTLTTQEKKYYNYESWKFSLPKKEIEILEDLLVDADDFELLDMYCDKTWGRATVL